MSNIKELSYSGHVTHAKQLAKDKKNKNKFYKSTTAKADKTTDVTDETLLEDSLAIKQENDRRKGSERRKSQHERGRYVESRLTKSRRYRKGLSVVI